MADVVCVPSSCVYRLPAALDLDVAVLAEPLAVAVHAVALAAIAPGENVLVLGAGAIGLLTVFAVARAGARVTVSARHPHQEATARMLGAARVIATDRDAIRIATIAEPPDVVLETVGGTAATLDLALKAVRGGGRIVVLGIFTQPIAIDPLRFIMKEVRFTGSMTYSRRGARPDFATALAHLAAERALLAQLITHRVPLAEASRGFVLAADKSSGAIKVVLTMASVD